MVRSLRAEARILSLTRRVRSWIYLKSSIFYWCAWSVFKICAFEVALINAWKFFTRLFSDTGRGFVSKLYFFVSIRPEVVGDCRQRLFQVNELKTVFVYICVVYCFSVPFLINCVIVSDKKWEPGCSLQSIMQIKCATHACVTDREFYPCHALVEHLSILWTRPHSWVNTLPVNIQKWLKSSLSIFYMFQTTI